MQKVRSRMRCWTLRKQMSLAINIAKLKTTTKSLQLEVGILFENLIYV